MPLVDVMKNTWRATVHCHCLKIIQSAVKMRCTCSEWILTAASAPGKDKFMVLQNRNHIPCFITPTPSVVLNS